LPKLSLSDIEILSYQINNLPPERSAVTFVPENATNQIRQFVLHQNYPNPFNPTTTIEYDLPEAAQVTLSIYNLVGEKVIELVNSYQTPGRKIVKWNGCNESGDAVTSGIYIYTLKAGKFEASRKMTIFR
jgi:hypothetical protein